MESIIFTNSHINNMEIHLYYFSGTGNSIHIGRELQKRLHDLILKPIVAALEMDDIKPDAQSVGILFPIHAHTIPEIVAKFLSRLNLEHVSYLFAFSNRECAQKVFKDINKILKKKQRKLNASFVVMMPVNYIPVFSVPTEKEIEELEIKMQKDLDDIVKAIVNKEEFHVKTNFLINVLANTLLRLSTFLFQKTRYFGLQKSFYADENCIGCGTCEKICLSRTIKMKEGKPVWRKNVDCIYCFACISFCPSQAIQAKGKRTTKKGRYTHPLVTANDIIKQKY